MLCWSLAFNKWDRFQNEEHSPQQPGGGGHAKAVDLWAQVTGVQKKPVNAISKQRRVGISRLQPMGANVPGCGKTCSLRSKEEKSIAKTDELVIHSRRGGIVAGVIKKWP